MDDRRWLDDVTGRYYKEIFCYCRRHVDTDDLAYELTQAVFLRLCEQYHTVSRESVRPWLYRVAAHLCADHYRSEYRERAWTVPLTGELGDFTAPSPEDSIEAVEYTDAIDYLLSKLNVSDQVLFRERYQQALSYTELARRRNTTEAAVRKRVSRMQKKLRRYIHILFHAWIFLLR